jgi:hypothetical protein
MTAGEWAEDFIFSAAAFGEEVREHYDTPVQKNKKNLDKPWHKNYCPMFRKGRDCSARTAFRRFEWKLFSILSS